MHIRRRACIHACVHFLSHFCPFVVPNKQDANSTDDAPCQCMHACIYADVHACVHMTIFHPICKNYSSLHHCFQEGIMSKRKRRRTLTIIYAKKKKWSLTSDISDKIKTPIKFYFISSLTGRDDPNSHANPNIFLSLLILSRILTFSANLRQYLSPGTSLGHAKVHP